jgi:ribosomal-protein-alanine N-acetyltransferase
MIWWPSTIPTLHYGKVRLRRPTDADVDSIFDACQDPMIPRFTTVPSLYTMAHALDFVQRVESSIELAREIPFIIEYGVGDEMAFAGVISLHTINLNNHCAEIGYWMSASMREKGIGTIAAKVITDYGIQTLGFRRIEALVDTDNFASQKLLLSAGYVKEGILASKVTREDGTQIDMVALATTADSWTPLEG